MLGAILMSACSGARVELKDAFVSDSSDSAVGGLAIASYILTDDGLVQSFRLNEQPDTVEIGRWIRPSAAAGLYKVRATLQSGNLNEGALDAWLELTQARAWTVSQQGAGTTGATLLIEISLDESTVLASATVTLDATVT